MKRKPDDEILNEGLIDQALAAEEEETEQAVEETPDAEA